MQLCKQYGKPAIKPKNPLFPRFSFRQDGQETYVLINKQKVQFENC